MRRWMVLLGVMGILGAFTGCHRPMCRNCEPCNQCGPGLLGGAPNVGCRPGPLRWQSGGTDYGHSLSRGAAVNPGPPTGTVGYPYYTVRGPRDFLLDNPPTIGR